VEETMNAKQVAFSLVGAGLLVAVGNAYADTPGRHPAYLRARADLRRAERLMEGREEPNVARDLAAASRETHEAIRELDNAALWDRKDIDDNPRIDTFPNRPGRFRAIAQFLSGARRDIEREEDNPAARAWRNRALAHIDQAIQFVRRASRDDWRDDWLR
jgi:hypothetical protein